MKRFERILFKLVLFQLFILIGVQTFFQDLTWFEYVNKLIQYEGVSGLEELDKLDVFQQKIDPPNNNE
ncbi:DUF5359 family protein [Lederbergia galactosidilytica]|uniref:YpfB family protein n=1 Tax=Lederbergia galactosidilytica TaxID=217031 RepID=A0A0Q9Y7R3_9BACI|nr:DUF5359 family protein [Lederbergia galactosidilytica]KRG09667.1 hypothetical protein ACA30_21725 [Virgibacillus soli]KRG12183.1 hypothetical protein ACA29_11610 [Lederbergia galactosidilytica]MBP1914647.1 hypothetical protein [Lederbergia galactosidilytica]OAK75810.1 hypothetical protein ABB05_00295 [Lederbergia galactosidilytica]